MTLQELTTRLQELCHNGYSLKNAVIVVPKHGEYNIKDVVLRLEDRDKDGNYLGSTILKLEGEKQ